MDRQGSIKHAETCKDRTSIWFVIIPNDTNYILGQF